MSTKPALPTEGDEVSQNSSGRSSRKLLGSLLGGVLACLLGIAVMTQVHQTERFGLENLSQNDLVALLSDSNEQSARLGGELDQLKDSQNLLKHGGSSAAVADARKRLDQLDILNGTVKVKGSGITISVDNSAHRVKAANILDAVEELRDAGAESIDVGGHRVVAASWFDDQHDDVVVDGARLDTKFTLTAIGDPHTLSTAMAIPGGVTDTLTQAGAHVSVSESNSVTITSVYSKKK